MSDFPANGHWTIYSIQKTLPFLGKVGSILGAHNYLALVAPDGTIENEIQGVYEGHFTVNGPTAGNYLRIRKYSRNSYMREQSVLSAKPVFSGSEAEMQARFQQGYEEVARALDKKRMLYDGAELFGHAVNSNSVWNTALRAMGVKDTSQFDGPGSTPGNNVDLREEPTNNKWFGSLDDLWSRNPDFSEEFGKNQESELDSEEALGIGGRNGEAVADARALLAQRLQNMEEMLDCLDEADFLNRPDELTGLMASITADLDNIDDFTGAALSDQIWRITDQVNQWLTLAYEEVQATTDPKGDDSSVAPQDVSWIERESDIETSQPHAWDNEEQLAQPMQDYDEVADTA